MSKTTVFLAVLSILVLGCHGKYGSVRSAFKKLALCMYMYVIRANLVPFSVL